MAKGERIGSLFSGIGGLDLGMEAATHATVAWQVECEPYCQTILRERWPNATLVADVRHLPPDLEPVDILCGGLLCQPHSVAGKRRGIDDARWLWPSFADAVGRFRPRLVVMENVRGLLTSSGGGAFAEVLGDLAGLGYNAEWGVFRASDAGSPHLRPRLFLLAYAHCDGQPQPPRGVSESGQRSFDGGKALADGDRERLEGWRLAQREHPTQQHSVSGGVGGGTSGGLECRLGRDADGISARLDAHQWPALQGEAQHPWEPPRTIQKAEMRKQRLMALGNAVVPHVARLALRTLAARAGVML